MVLFGIFRNRTVEDGSSKFIKEVEENSKFCANDCFHNPLWLVKANEALKDLSGPLNEDIYRSKILVLNGIIEQKLRAATEIFNASAISSLIFEFDSLIHAGSGLLQTDSLKEFHPYAKCLFLSRIGDFVSNSRYQTDVNF